MTATIGIVLAVVIVVLVAGALWFIKNRPQKSRPGDDDSREPVEYTVRDILHTRSAPMDFENENPAYLAMTPEEYEILSRQLETVLTSVGEGYYSIAYTKLEGFLDRVSRADRETLAKGLVVCVRAMCREKRPQGVLDLYDKLSASGPGIRLVEVCGRTPEISEAFMESLEAESRDITWGKSSARKRIELLRQDHPLIKALLEQYFDRLLGDLNHIGNDLAGDKWKPGERFSQCMNELDSLTRE